jgi:hypothetical protein
MIMVSMWKSELSQSVQIWEDECNRFFKLQILNLRTSTKSAYLFVTYFMTLSVREITERRELR